MNTQNFNGYLKTAHQRRGQFNQIEDLFTQWESLIDNQDWQIQHQLPTNEFDFVDNQGYQYLKVALDQYTGADQYQYQNQLELFNQRTHNFNQLVQLLERYYFNKHPQVIGNVVDHLTDPF